MSVTIQVEPSDWNPASNPCVFEFSSTNTGQANFSMIVELTVNGSVHSYHQVFPESSNYGKFDASEVLRSIVYSDIVTDGTFVSLYSNAVATYSIRVREKYGTPPTEQGSWTSASTTLNAFNASLRHQDWIGYDYTDYDVTTQVDKTFLFLTDFPRSESYYCGLNESVFLGHICTDTSTTVRPRLYDVNGSLIASDNVTITIPSSDLVMIDASPQTIIDNSTITSSDFASCYYYTIQGRATGGGSFSGGSEEFRIYIDQECTQYTTRRLHWLNKYGMWDSYTFNKYSEEQGEVQSFGYESESGAWNDSNQWTYNQYAGQRKNYAKTSKDTMTLNSDWIKESKYQWLVRSLYESPVVYLEVSQGVFEEVKVLNSSYTLKQRIRHGLLQEVVRLERTYTYRSQLN